MSAFKFDLGRPIPFLSMSPTASPVNFTLNQTTDAMEYVFQAQEAITITRLGFRYGARTGTPPTYKISLQGVDGSGNPDGTIVGGGTPASGTFTPPADTTWDGLWKWITLDNAFTCTRGQLFSIVIAYSSGTVDGSNNSSFTRTTDGDVFGFPYQQRNDAGSRTRSNAPPIFGYGSSSAAYGTPHNSVTSLSFNSGSTPDEYAMAFTLDSGWGSTFTVGGVTFSVGANGSARNAKILLYSGTTVLQTFTYDGDDVATVGGPNISRFVATETTLSTLNFGSQYRIAVQPQDTSNWSWAYIQLAAAGDLTAYPGGSSWFQSSRTDAGAWSDDTTIRPLCQLLISDWAFSGGSGGMLYHTSGG